MKPKRLISLLVAVCMVVAMLPVSAFAADAENNFTIDYGTYKLKYAVNADATETVSIIGYEGTPRNLEIPSTVTNGAVYKVTAIGDNAFFQSTVTSVIFEEESNIKKIGDSTFAGCYSLSEIEIPRSVEWIGDYAFNWCGDAFKELTFQSDSKLYHLGDGAFGNCTSLTRIELPDNVKELGDWIFNGCTTVTEITLPKSVEKIGQGAFGNCTKLKTIKYEGTQEQWEKLTAGTNNTIPEERVEFVRSLTVSGGIITVADEAVNGNVLNVPLGAKVTVTFNKDAFADSGSAFGYWKITGLDDPNAYQDKESFTFTMPDNPVTIEAMTKDSTIEDDSSSVLGTVAIGVTVVAGTAVLAYQGYMLGTEFWLNYHLPYGVDIPANRAELAQLVWVDAGRPEPAAVLNADATNADKALVWAVENQLMAAADKNGEALAPDASVSRVDVIRTWKKYEQLKKNA